MARSPRPTSSKARGGQKARAGGNTGSAETRASEGPASKKRRTTRKGPAPQARASSQRTPAKAQGKRRQPQAESWAASVGSLINSQLGREILADVLNAAAGVLRQNRQMGQQAQEAGRAVIDRGTDAASTAVQVGTEVASGAVNTGVGITSAAVDIAQAAAGTLATVATEAMLNMLPGAPTGEDQGQQGDRRKGARNSRTGREES